MEENDDDDKDKVEDDDDAQNPVEPLQMNEWDLLEVDEEYSIAYQVVNLAPTTIKEAIEYYNTELPKSNLYKAEEQAVIHLALAKIYVSIMIADDENNKDTHIYKKSKSEVIEKCLKHLKKAMTYFNYDVYPLVFGIICVLTAQSLRHQYMEIGNSKSPATRRVLTRSDCLRKGIDLLYESCGVFSQSKQHSLEYTICSLDAGFLRLLQIENQDMSESESRIHREYAIINLEEAAHQLELTVAQSPYADNLGALTLPKHAVLLLAGRNPRSLKGLIHYLLGRAHQPTKIRYSGVGGVGGAGQGGGKSNTR